MLKSVLRWSGVEELGNAVRYVRRRRRVQTLMTLAEQELEQFRLERLRAIVKHAYENVELYQRTWRQAGVRPDEIRTLDDLRKLPLTTKEDLRGSFPGGVLSRRYRPADCFLLGTSGSTGTPVRVYHSLDRALTDFSLSLPQYMAGLPPVTPATVIRDYFLRRHITYMAIVVDEPRAYESLHGRVFWSMRHTVVDSLEPASVHLRAINTKRPRYIFSYPSTVRNICLAAREKGVRMHRPQLIMVAGEVLDDPLRALVRQTFGCALLDVYGSTELGYIACECPRHEGLHVFTWKVLVELLDETGREVRPGATGRVVVTDLFNEATPIIRYDGLGDYATRGEQPCACGRTTPLLTRVEGRVVDSIVLPDGQIVHPYHLTLALEDVPGVSKFQIRQERPDYLRVLLVKDAAGAARGISFAPDGAVGRAILDRFDRILHRQVQVELVTTEDIPRRPGSHKYATVVSLVKTD
jgi:phenylacetate-CoA ligase